MMDCPCGLGDDYEACCRRLHAGSPAPTAEALMRSRYSAFAVTFRAIYSQGGRRGVMTETSRFVRQDKRWTYLGPLDQ